MDPSTRILSLFSRSSIALAAVLVLAAAVLSYELTEPFVGHHDFNSAWMSSAAKNHLRYGYTATRLGVIKNNAVVPPEWFLYYTSHPPLVPLFASLSFWSFGEHEWAARLVPIIFSLGSTVLVYLLGAAVGGRRLGLLSALIYALLPMTAYFGRVLNHEAPTNFFALATALAYLRWHQVRRVAPFVLAVAALVLGALCGWPGYYLAGLLPLHHVVASEHGRREWKVLLLPLTAIIVFGLHLWHIFLLQGSGGLLDLGHTFLSRTNLSLSPWDMIYAEFTWANFIAVKAKDAIKLFTPPVLILAALSLYDIARRRCGAVLSDPLFIVVLLLFGITHVVLFSFPAFYHDYWPFYCSAALSVLAANAALSLAGPASDRRVLAFLVLLFILAPLPTILSLHRKDRSDVYQLALLLKEHTRPGEYVLTNARLISDQAPELGYYAERDVSLGDPVFGIAELKWALAGNRRRPLALFVLEEGQGVAELEPWLSSRYPRERSVLLGNRYLIYHIDPEHPVAMERRAEKQRVGQVLGE